MLKINTMSSQNLEQLRTTKKSNKTIQGTCNYDILSNPDYQLVFHYIPLSQRHSDQDKMSDLITNLFFLSPHYHHGVMGFGGASKEIVNNALMKDSHIAASE